MARPCNGAGLFVPSARLPRPARVVLRRLVELVRVGGLGGACLRMFIWVVPVVNDVSTRTKYPT